MSDPRPVLRETEDAERRSGPQPKSSDHEQLKALGKLLDVLMLFLERVGLPVFLLLFFFMVVTWWASDETKNRIARALFLGDGPAALPVVIVGLVALALLQALGLTKFLGDYFSKGSRELERVIEEKRQLQEELLKRPLPRTGAVDPEP